jgi:hypothetical protein
MGVATSSYATAGTALRVSGALKPHHHDNVETPSVGESYSYFKENIFSFHYKDQLVDTVKDNNICFF